ncbi:MAG: hypothetical protein HY815_07495 [Candidatus Riflebacteria bacterium]|nr:hypothetical protein [Candidatus Riflebacteria bacterium]
MEMLCPECRGPLVSDDGQWAVCKIHGGRYRVLFVRQPAAPPAPLPQLSADQLDPTGRFCAAHPAMPAAWVCGCCASPICDTCSFAVPPTTHLCAKCMVERRASRPAGPVQVEAPPPPPGTMCVAHPAVAAARYCKLCKNPMCETCSFILSPGLEVCPRCASAPRPELSSGRKRTLVWSYGLAVWSAICTVLFFVAAAAGAAKTKAGQDVVGAFFTIFVLIPSVVGTALAYSSYDSRYSNPLSVWISLIWNSLTLIGLFLLMLVGMMMG